MAQTKNTGKPLRQKNLRDPAATREALMQAGSELFAARGFDGVPVEAIAERAGANKAMINYHFGGKRGLYQAILLETFEEIGAEVRAISQRPDDARTQIAAFIDFVLQLGTTRRVAFPALFLREVMSGEGPDLEVFKRLGMVVSSVMEIVRRGVAEGALRPIDPFNAYFMLMAPMSLFLATQPVRVWGYEKGLLPFPPPPPTQFAEQLKQTLLQGLGVVDGEKEKS
jgi:TetR/AcrR family transcriptional regulator